VQESNTVGCTLNEESIVNEEMSPVVVMVVLLFGDMCVCFSLFLWVVWYLGMKMRSITNFEKCRYLGFQSFFF